ncbi:unnamed protein product [Cyclocybe aegerita]|uniref:Uncharacterized protein n=1 Tax=Cyclocybe aegerita TaxID=1973307 RepID=A0A8S0XX04_CYCAE|nr:unnamed protein product [Cyclocybe aegerita]
MSVRPAETKAMESQNVLPITSLLLCGKQLRYLCYNVWDPESDLLLTTAEWTESAISLPQSPASALNDLIVAKTIHDNPHLFKIVSPINVNVFESYLSDYPNQPFVQSVITDLWEGFWPWADTCKTGYPTTNNCSKALPKDDGKAAFLRNQLKMELKKERFSPLFGKDLLPAMAHTL